jgi:plasmid rolling circle replication initiator protein Rep
LSYLSEELRKHEFTLPKNQRGSWNHRIAFDYKKKTTWVSKNLWDIETREELFDLKVVENKYGESMYERTDIEKAPGFNYNHLDNTGNQLRWNRLRNCQSKIELSTDHTTGEMIYRALNKCNDKLCGNCSQIRSVIAVTKYKNKVQAMKNPVMVVLHQKSPKMGELKETINAMYSDWREILRLQAKSKRENYNGICALEVTTNEKEQTYHPHYHIIIEKHQADDLVNRWCDMEETRKRQNQKIEEENTKRAETNEKPPLEFHKVLHREKEAHKNKTTKLLYSDLPKDEKGNMNINELFKYAMKMSVTNQDKPGKKLKTIGSIPMIYEIAKSLKGVQQWRPFGDFRNTPNTKEISEAIQNEMMVSKADWPHIQLSKRWIWNKNDWEAYDNPGLTLTGWEPTERDIAFIRLKQPQYNNFVNERIQKSPDEFEQFIRLQTIETPGNDTTIQEVPRSQITQRSI